MFLISEVPLQWKYWSHCSYWEVGADEKNALDETTEQGSEGASVPGDIGVWN